MSELVAATAAAVGWLCSRPYHPLLSQTCRMNPPQHDLETIQRWMQSVIMCPGGVTAGADSKQARELIDISPAQIGEVVNPSSRLDAVGRLEVYADAYFARLLECMRSEFPVLAMTMGEELFDELVVGYLNAYPSRTYTLGRLGANFARYLQESCPRDDRVWADFMIDLARLEWTFNEIFDGPGSENDSPLTPADLADVSPEQWPHAGLVAAVPLRLMQFAYPVSRYYGQRRRDDSVPIPQPCESYVAISRRDYTVRRHELTHAQFELLRSLFDGRTVAEAIAHSAEFDDAPWDQFAAKLQEWFRQWAAEQIFSRIVLP